MLLQSPNQGSAIAEGAAWIEHLLLGTVGTAIAMSALAMLGYSMFTGRLPARAGIRAVLGCFILFGAPMIAAGFMKVVDSGRVAAAPSQEVGPLSSIIPRNPPNGDPYAGAAVPWADRPGP